MKLELHFPRTLKGILLAIGVALLPAWEFGAQAGEGQTAALTNWQAAVSRFQKAGLSIAEKKYPQAKSELISCATNMPEPYSKMANQFLVRLESALKQSTNSDNSTRLEALLKVCVGLRAYEAVSQLKAAAPKTPASEVDAEEPVSGWYHLESGNTDAAIAAYQRESATEPTIIFQQYYKKQIELVKRRSENLTNVQFAIEFVHEHYLKGYEEKADSFAALKELYRVLPYAHDPKEALAVYRLMIQCLSSLGDDSGRDAWEDKTLSDLKSDPEACAEVYLNRGIRAFLINDFQQAEVYFRKACSEYPNTNAYGDAQINLGAVFHEQNKYDEAIEEYAKLFSSNVNDYRLIPGTSEDYRNYRHKAAIRISECYESKKNFAQALAYAEMAMHQYKPLSWCGTCLATAKEALERRIERLQKLVAKPN
jgi:tetratricopeptide (TPR) repeat protein